MHDERLCHLYAYLKRLPSNFVIDDVNGSTSLCFHDIIHADPLIVHSKKLQKIIMKTYNKNAIYIPFCSFNRLQRYDENKIAQFKKKYKLDGDINITVNGRIKYPHQVLKICEYLKTKNIYCKIFFVGP